jgi:hypothetical protein
MTGPLNGSRMGAAVGGTVVDDGCRGTSVGVAVGNEGSASGSTVAVGTAAVANACADSTASSSATRCTTIVLPNPSR